MTLRFDGFYRSGLQRSEDWHAGVCMVDQYFEYLKLWENGLWLRKFHPTSELDFATYLVGVDDQAFRDGLDGRHSRDKNYDFLHQTGRFTRQGSRLELVLCHRLVIMHGSIIHEMRWEFHTSSSDRLVPSSGALYTFVPIGQA